jgi:hypothetical protein
MLNRVIALGCLLFICFSCGHKKDAKAFEKLLEETTGQEHSVAKLDTETGDYVVFYNEVTGVYTAYNMDKFDRKKMTTYGQYSANAVEGTDIVRQLERTDEWIEDGYSQDIYEYETYYYDVYDEECDCWYTESYTESYYVGTEWVDTSYWYTYFTGGGFRFDNTSTISKDLEMISALAESTAQKVVTEKLQSEFALSADRATELSGLMMKYQKLETARELTTDEKDQLALKSLGVTVTQMERALKEKDQNGSTAYADLLKEAAQVNRTTPEQMDKIMDEVSTLIQ